MRPRAMLLIGAEHVAVYDGDADNAPALLVWPRGFGDVGAPPDGAVVSSGPVLRVRFRSGSLNEDALGFSLSYEAADPATLRLAALGAAAVAADADPPRPLQLRSSFFNASAGSAPAPSGYACLFAAAAAGHLTRTFRASSSSSSSSREHASPASQAGADCDAARLAAWSATSSAALGASGGEWECALPTVTLNGTTLQARVWLAAESGRGGAALPAGAPACSENSLPLLFFRSPVLAQLLPAAGPFGAQACSTAWHGMA